MFGCVAHYSMKNGIMYLITLILKLLTQRYSFTFTTCAGNGPYPTRCEPIQVSLNKFNFYVGIKLLLSAMPQKTACDALLDPQLKHTTVNTHTPPPPFIFPLILAYPPQPSCDTSTHLATGH